MKLDYHKDFRKQFARLPVKIQDKFGERMALFLQDKFNPILNNHSVEPTYPDCRSINITGDYRTIFKEADEFCIFVKIGTHSELY